jgi:O-methyltransferase
MDNVFITEHFDWDEPEPWKVRLVNRLLRRLGASARLVRPFRTGAQTNVEQRINMFHLLAGVLTYGVPGDVAELGTHSGSSAVLFRKVIDGHDPSRRLHVYDAFRDPPVGVMLQNFQNLGLRPPEAHAGWFAQTVPAELPDQVCFAHIDCGPGPSAEEHAATIRLLLESVYPRMPRGAVCLLADYWDPDVYRRHGFHFPRTILADWLLNQYPQVKQAADAFLRDKPEKISVLYAGEYAHGFFRKA